LHIEMDRAVTLAYSWPILLDGQVVTPHAAPSTPHAPLDLGHGFHETKQGTRFTISESARREVLARLLKLNHERYAEEVAQGLHEKKRGAGSVGRGARKTGTRGKRKGANETDLPSLFS
jgi:hypothetical protein